MKVELTHYNWEHFWKYMGFRIEYEEEYYDENNSLVNTVCLPEEAIEEFKSFMEKYKIKYKEV